MASPGAQHAPLTLVHQDAWLIAVHKPAGLLVHRSALDAHEPDDLVTRLTAQLSTPLWLVHRLDKGTSGLILLARDAATAGTLGRALAAGEVAKRYLALVRGWPADAGEIDQPLARDPEQPSAGQPRLPATTRWQVLARHTLPVATRPGFEGTRIALVAVTPLTGRRHQIRRHFKHLGHPLIGDSTHGKGPLNRAVARHLGLARLWLHAEQLRFMHPITGLPVTLMAPPGPEWASWQSAPASAQGEDASPVAARR